MFGFFKKNNNECPVNEETRQWLEKCFIWFVQVFGEESIRNRKVLIPDYTDFPIKYNGQEQAAFNTLKIIAKQMEIDPSEIHLDIYAEGQKEIGEGDGLGNKIFMQNAGDQNYSGGLYFGKQEDNKFHIGLEKKILTDPITMVAALSHELSHIKLLGEKKIEQNNEELTDLTTIIFGLGIFNANAAFERKQNYDSLSWSKLGYLSQMEWGYALALYAYIRKEENPEWIKYLTRNIKSDFKQAETYIHQQQDSMFKNEIKKNERYVTIEKRIIEGNEKRDFNAVIEAYRIILEDYPEDIQALNNIGYALIQQKKYEEAIDYFNKVIQLDPAWDYAINNKGYCRLQLGDLKNAFIDLNRSYELNPSNSFSWRNLGAYYLKINEAEKALTHFEEAEKLDPGTEMINFYLGKAHEKLGNQQKAKNYSDRSVELNEWNDSLS